ncbi:hypothetical protein [Pseudomonas graminis]
MNFYEESKSIYAAYMNKLEVILFGVSYSIYLRGSANKPSRYLNFKPWDIDLVLFCCERIDEKIVSKIKKITFDFNDEISILGHPYVDIRFFENASDNNNDKFLLYLLKKDSYIIKGTGDERVNNAEKPNGKELYELYKKNVEIVINKHHYLSSKKEDSDDYPHRVKNIIKSISRCGCILVLLREDIFTRDVNTGLDALYRYFMDDSFINMQLPLTRLDHSRDIDLAIIKMLEYKME